MILGETGSLLEGTSNLKALFDVGMCGIIVNTLVFAFVSRLSSPPDKAHREAFARDLRAGS